MIQAGAFLKVVDNSGARLVECIKVLGKKGRGSATLGDLIVVSIKQLRKKGRIKVKKKEICIGLIVKIVKKKNTKGVLISYSSNSCILMTRQKKLLGTRFFGSLPFHLKSIHNFKYITLSSNFL